jgi:NADPH:quinone reductase-like Zn-dependent oxidoreductase
MAVQIARAIGANVYAAVSSSKVDLIRSNGAIPIDLAETTIDDVLANYTEVYSRCCRFSLEKVVSIMAKCCARPPI